MTHDDNETNPLIEAAMALGEIGYDRDVALMEVERLNLGLKRLRHQHDTVRRLWLEACAENEAFRKIAAIVIETSSYSGAHRPPFCSFPVCRLSPYGWPPREDWHNPAVGYNELVRRIQHAPACPVTRFRALLANDDATNGGACDDHE